MITVTHMTPESATLVAGDTQIHIQVIGGKANVSLSPLDKSANKTVSDYKSQYQSSTVQRRRNNTIPSDLAARLDSLFI